jgi:aspartate-semialdehyde dehydrogenase
MSKGFHVAIVGATGAVGQELMIVFQERNFPISELTLLASARSHGKKLKYCGDQLTIF